MRKPDIELTVQERRLFEQIEFDQGLVSFETYEDNSALVEQLYDLLVARDALPSQRVRWFTEAEFNPRGRGSSRQDRWRRNGTSGREVLRHANFLGPFAYFICGPDLPSGAQNAFREAVDGCGRVSSGDAPLLSKTARAIAREHGLEAHHASEEFYKLSLDLGLGRHAKSVYDGVRRLR
jgi:hypothetical protein